MHFCFLFRIGGALLTRGLGNHLGWWWMGGSRGVEDWSDDSYFRCRVCESSPTRTPRPLTQVAVLVAAPTPPASPCSEDDIDLLDFICGQQVGPSRAAHSAANDVEGGNEDEGAGATATMMTSRVSSATWLPSLRSSTGTLRTLRARWGISCRRGSGLRPQQRNSSDFRIGRRWPAVPWTLAPVGGDPSARWTCAWS